MTEQTTNFKKIQPNGLFFDVSLIGKGAILVKCSESF